MSGAGEQRTLVSYQDLYDFPLQTVVIISNIDRILALILGVENT
jgi:hypothetical protein